MTTTADTDAAEMAAGQAQGLRDLAALIEANPRLAVLLDYTFGSTIVPLSMFEDPRAEMALVARAFGRAEKDYEAKWAHVNVACGPIRLSFYAQREQVCERVVTGTETVTKTVPDPEALAAVPTVEVTETVETVEWVCSPLLASVAVSA